MKRLTMSNGDVIDDPNNVPRCVNCGGPMGEEYIKEDTRYYCSYRCYTDATALEE